MENSELKVLVGYFKTERHLAWCKEKQLYNFRLGKSPDSFELTPGNIGAKYLLLYTKNKLTNELWEIVGLPQVYSKRELIEADYPGEPGYESYLILSIRKPKLTLDGLWNVKIFSGYQKEKHAHPFSVSLAELLNNNNGL